MMQKFLVTPEHVYDSPDPDDRRKLTEYYLASEVDAEHSELIAHNVEAHARITELEKALREILGVATVTSNQKTCEIPREVLGRARNALMGT